MVCQVRCVRWGMSGGVCKVETIFQRLIVSDGNGLKKKEGEPLQKKGAQTSAELS